MSFATPLLGINWLFRINNTEERGQVGMHALVNNNQAPATYLAAFTGDLTGCAALCTAMSNLWSTASGLSRGEYASLYGLKLQSLNTNGTYAGEPFIYSMPTPVTGGSANVPPSSTVTVSFRSSQTLGRGNRGRMYLPYSLMAQGVGTATATATTTSTLATATRAFVISVNTTLGLTTPGASLVIASRAGTGVNKAIASVRVGNINDVQRRRRNRLPETYSSLNI